MECLVYRQPDCFGVNPLLCRWKCGDFDDCCTEEYDPRTLLPVVTPILDEYEQVPACVDSCDSIDSDNTCNGGDREQKRDSNAYFVESDFDKEREGQPGMTEETLRFHEVALEKTVSLEAVGSFISEETVYESKREDTSDEQIVCRGKINPWASEESNMKASCPRLPRPPLWTLSERGESSGSQASALDELWRSNSGEERFVHGSQDQFHFIDEEDGNSEQLTESDLTPAEENASTFRRYKLNDVKKKLLLSRPLRGRAATC